MTETIVVKDVYKSYGDLKALDGVSIRADEGQVLGLLGPNGAGKTTLVRILTTLLVPDSGEAYVAGIDVLKEKQRVREIIGLAGQYPAVDEILTGRENLSMVGQLYHMPRKEARARADELLKQFTLEDAADRPVKTYSGGMRRRLDLAASIVARPQILFLDEPTTGLDPRTRIDMWNAIRQLVSGGTTLLLTTQYLEEADELADEIVVLDRGRVIAEGTSSQLKANLASDYIDLQIGDRGKMDHAAQVLQPLSEEELKVDRQTDTITLSVNNGSQSIVEAVRVLDRENINLSGLNLRQPSLNDVFLSLTGQEIEEEKPKAQSGRRARRSA